MDDPQWQSPAPTGVTQLDEQHQRMHQLFRLLEAEPGFRIGPWAARTPLHGPVLESMVARLREVGLPE